VLTHLQIRDFAIVEAVEVELGAGFTALTGETGAGKSILVDALLLAVGGRADSGAVRHGASRAEITATFDVSANEGALAWLAGQDIDHDGEVLLRRSVGADGRGRAWINGRTMPVQALHEVGERLLEVHGQLEFQLLGRRSYQRELLDSSGGLQEELQVMREAYRAWRRLEQDRAAFDVSGREREHDSGCWNITSRNSRHSTRSWTRRPNSRRNGGASAPWAGSPRAPRRSRHCWPVTMAT